MKQSRNSKDQQHRRQPSAIGHQRRLRLGLAVDAGGASRLAA